MDTKSYWLFMALLAAIAIASLSGVEGQLQEQYLNPEAGYSTATPGSSQNPAQYSQFYGMTSGPAPSNPISAPQEFNVASNLPTTIYLAEQMQPVPYDQCRSNPANTAANALWIKGSTAWTQYALVPLGSTVSLLAISPSGGNGLLTYVDPNGQTNNNNYAFYPNSLLTFYAETAGRHTLSFAVNGGSSNQVVIDVTTGGYTEPSPINYPGYYYPRDYYPECYYPGGYYNGCYYPASYYPCGCFASTPSTPAPPSENNNSSTGNNKYNRSGRHNRHWNASIHKMAWNASVHKKGRNASMHGNWNTSIRDRERNKTGNNMYQSAAEDSINQNVANDNINPNPVDNNLNPNAANNNVNPNITNNNVNPNIANNINPNAASDGLGQNAGQNAVGQNDDATNAGHSHSAINHINGQNTIGNSLGQNSARDN